MTNKFIRAALALILLALLGACAEPARMTAMIAVPSDTGGRSPAPSYQQAIMVTRVAGGTETNALWMSKVGDAEFKEALVQSLVANGLAATREGRFVLEAVLMKLEQPYFGLDLKVTATIAYKLTDTSGGGVVYQNTLVTSGVATFSDAPIAVMRLKISNERAIRANLTKLIEELLALPDRPAAGRSA